MHSNSRGAVLKKLLVFLCSTAVLLVAMEWAVGRYFPVGGQIYGPNAELLFDAVPNSSRIQVMPKEHVGEGDATHVAVRISADGFRGPALDVPKRRKRVLLIGDSLVMAENVPVQGTFVQALGRELGRRVVGEQPSNEGAESTIETVNAGRSGYGPDQALLLLERDLERVEPDLIVCVLCAHNDFGDLMRNKLFRLGEGGALERLAPTLSARLVDLYSEIQERSDKSALARLWGFYREGRPPSDESLSAGTMNEYARALTEQAREHIVDRNTEVLSIFRDVYDIDVAASLPDSFAAAKIELMTGVLARMVRFAADQDVPIAFVVVPSAVDVCGSFGVEVDSARFPSHRKTGLVDAMAGAVGLAGGVAIDVTPALLGNGPADRYFVGGTDMHWNTAGQGACASFVAEELLRDTAAAKALGVAR